MSYHKGVSHELKYDDRCCPHIHIPIGNVVLPVCVRTPWIVGVQQPHLFAKYRLGGYPNRSHEHHHGREARVEYVAFLARSTAGQQSTHGLKVKEQLGA